MSTGNPRSIPITADQSALWLGGSSTANQRSWAFTIRGALSVTALREALTALSARHESLRSSFAPGGKQLRLWPPTNVTLRMFTLSPTSGAEEWAVFVRDTVDIEQREPFDLTSGPMFRAGLCSDGARRHCLILSAHLLCADQVSWSVLASDLGTLYAEALRGTSGLDQGSSALPHAPSFVANNERIFEAQTAGADASARHWKEQFTSAPSPLDLPVDHPRTTKRVRSAATLVRELSPDTQRRLSEFSAHSDVDAAQTCLAATFVLLSRLTEQDDIVVVTKSEQLSAGARANSVGSCRPLYPLRLKLQSRDCFADVVRRVADAYRQVESHPHVDPFGLLAQFGGVHDATRRAISTVFFGSYPEPRLSLSGLETETHPAQPAETDFEWKFALVRKPTGLLFSLTYNLQLFDEAQAQLRLAEFETLLVSALTEPSRSVSELSLLTKEEEELLAEVGVGPVDLRPDVPAHQLIERSVARFPEATALEFQGKTLTYAAMDARANALAHALVERGVVAGDLVAVILRRGLDLPIALQAIWKVGAAYVPIDPDYPASRIRMILKDAAPRVIVTESRVESDALSAFQPALVRLNELSLTPRSSAPQALAQPDALAYVIFTSGSTGRPKGVRIRHSAFSNFLQSMAKAPGMRPGDKLLAVTTICFDIAGLEMFLPLIVGGTTEIVSRNVAVDGLELKSKLESGQYALFQATPATYRMLFEAGWNGTETLKVLCGGEAFPLDLAARLVSGCKEVWNMYGPTETTVWSTLHRVTAEDTEFVPIGRPIHHTQIVLLDAAGERVPLGVPGALYIGGAGLAAGYHLRDDLTQSAFVDSRHATDPREPRLYRTGDLARYHVDGRLECLGRTDYQVKIRGFRIELGEIEHHLQEFEGVRDAVVIAREYESGDKRLVAYLTWKAKPPECAEQIQAHLARRLPSHMIPTAFVSLDQLPLSPARKVDRKRLPEPESGARLDPVGLASPTTDTEVRVAQLFARALDVPRVGIHDHFVDAGGHSIRAIGLLKDLSTEFGSEFDLAMLNEAPTVAEMAALIDAGGWGDRASPVVKLYSGDGSAPLFLLRGVYLYQELARTLNSAGDVYAVYLPEETDILRDDDGKLVPDGTHKLAAAYIRAIKKRRPKGPYHIAGMSYGGVIGYEIAQQLTQAGEEVGFLGLFDPVLSRRHHPFPARWLLRKGQQTLQRLTSKRPRAYVLGSDFTPSAPTSAPQRMSSKQLMRVIEVYAKSMKPYPGNLDLFVAQDRQDQLRYLIPADCGWGRWIRGRFSVTPVPGDHLTMFAKPHVVSLAAAVNERLAPVL